MSQALSFHVLGAGLAGTLSAIYLARRDAAVDVYERRADPRTEQGEGGRSINLALANRGRRALAGVGLERDIEALTIPMRGRMLHEVGKAPVLQPYGKDDSEVIYSISRAGLNALLLNQADAHGVGLHFEHRTEAVDVDTGEVLLTDPAGTRVALSGRPIIAADGGGSVVRRTLGRRPGALNSEVLSSHGYKELTIPAGPDGAFRIDPNALHIWPRGGFMMIALPNLDGSFTVTLFMAMNGENSFDELTDADQVSQFFEHWFPSAVPLLPDLLHDFFANPTGELGTVRCAPWHADDKAVLIGDAAHAIVPFHGQGMNCAFEDCFELDRCLFDIEAPSLADRFAEFERRRRPNANAIADMAIENYIEMRESVRDPYFHLKKALAFELERRFPGDFVPRYSMVMFHHIPYAEAQRRGVIQQSILDELLLEHPRELPLGDIDYGHAEALIREQLADAPGLV